jgi:signal transduction histidine kinase
VKDEDYSIKKSMEEVMQIAQSELQKKNIEVTVSNASDLPNLARGDSFKFKQILLNLILQSISGTYKGFVKIKTEMSYSEVIPMVVVEIDNSKFELHKKDNMRIMKLT